MQRITQKLVVPKTVRVGATANNQEVNNNQEVKSGETLLEELTALYNGGGINKDEALLLLAALESEKTPQQVLKEGQYPEMQVKIDGFRLNIDQTNIISTHLSGEGKIVKLFNSWKPHMEKPSGLFSHSTKHTVYFNAAYKILRIAAGIDHAKGFKVQLDGFMQYYTLKEDSTTTIYAIREFNNCIAGILSEQKRGGDSQMYYAHSETTLRLLKDTDQSVIFKVVINNRSNLRDLILNLFNAEKIKQIYGTILQLQYGLDQIEDLLLHRLGQYTSYNQNVNQMEVEKYQSTINKIIKESNRNDHPENRRPSDQTKRRDFFGTPSTAEIENTDSPREILLQSTTTATVQNTTLSFDNLEDELKKVTDVQCARLYNNNLPQCNYEDHIKAVFELLDRHSSKDLIRSLRYGSCLLRTAIENLFNLDDMKDIYGGEVDKATIDTNRCRVVKQLLMKLLDNIQNNQRPLQPNDEYLYVIYVIAISDDQKAYDKAKDMDIQPNKDMLNTIKDRFKEDSDIPGLVDQIMSTINVSADALSGSQPWQGTTGHPKRELR